MRPRFENAGTRPSLFKTPILSEQSSPLNYRKAELHRSTRDWCSLCLGLAIPLRSSDQGTRSGRSCPRGTGENQLKARTAVAAACRYIWQALRVVDAPNESSQSIYLAVLAYSLQTRLGSGKLPGDPGSNMNQDELEKSGLPAVYAWRSTAAGAFSELRYRTAADPVLRAHLGYPPLCNRQQLTSLICRAWQEGNRRVLISQKLLALRQWGRAQAPSCLCTTACAQLLSRCSALRSALAAVQPTGTIASGQLADSPVTSAPWTSRKHETEFRSFLLGA